MPPRRGGDIGRGVLAGLTGAGCWFGGDIGIMSSHIAFCLIAVLNSRLAATGGSYGANASLRHVYC